MIADRLKITDDRLAIRIDNSAPGPGNVVTVIVKSENVTEVFTGLGKRGVPAEKVANNVVREVKHYLRAGIAVNPYLADQLLLPIALAGSGSFQTIRPSLHTLTNISVIELFMDSHFTVHEVRPDVWQIDFTT